MNAMSPITHQTLENVTSELENMVEQWISALGFYVAWSCFELGALEVK